MTDITELAQSLKAAAEKATPGQWERGDGKHGGELLVYCDDALGSAVCEATSEYNAIPKYQRIDNLDFIALANPANILALVEALESEKRICATWIKTAKSTGEKLEKAQVKNALVAGGTEATAKLHERITELEREVEKWKQESESWEHVAEKQLATAIELESRTVKLPTTRLWAGVTECYEKSDVIAAILSAGVEVSDD
ncbi:ead/Ea22-like family protein [Klebsiella variicola]|uniref:ead/Ea22-like family protein n=1 Tax=Klebsiella variicola TaxID=244366 RepID=UPI0035A189B3